MPEAILLYKCRLCGLRVEGHVCQTKDSYNQSRDIMIFDRMPIYHDCDHPGFHGIADFIGYKEIPEREAEHD